MRGKVAKMARESEKQPKPKAIIVGGSIAGVSCAHALTLAGWNVVVLEKTCAPPPEAPPAPDSDSTLWLRDSSSHGWVTQILSTKPPYRSPLIKYTTLFALSMNQAIDGKKIRGTLTRDENLNFRAAHWADLHGLLYNALAEDVFLWGHLFLSFSISDDKSCVKVKSKVLETGEIIETVGDLLVAADGCLSAIREHFLPDLQLRYSGYCAWRGVLDFSENENSETIQGMRRAYPDLGKCLYFDLGSGTHSGIYELLNKRMNWLWYVNQPQPEMKGKSVTMKVSSDMIEKMHQEAEMAWAPELVRVMKETKEPFLNAIYDSVLGKCLEKWGVENLSSALEEYQSTRLPVTSKQVLHARRLGRLKQGLILADREPFDPKTASLEDCEELQQKNMPFFADIPLPLNS
ncbi:hypothetical protein CK203_005326 [Vitis vinifera]|uniref:FAD-binding domain-containing protein n=1 Tax=Vitis vinifera TaxID=29760 RepID=A0A438KES6_VITVI|nr:hypothetical protein CK203_005326 [Vitis vinifera]